MISDLLSAGTGFISGSWLANNLTSNKYTIQTRIANLIWCLAMFWFAYLIYGLWNAYDTYTNLALLVGFSLMCIEGIKALVVFLNIKNKEKGEE